MRATAPIPDEPTWKCPKFRKTKPDVKITIELKSGERTQISATRWHDRFITSDGIRSISELKTGIGLILKHCQ